MRLLHIFVFFFPLLVFAQDGPGGIGTTDGSSNLSLWLDAGKIYGVSDGANISTWNDQSGNGYNASVETNAPSYSATGGGNSQPAVTFDNGNNESLVITGNSELNPTGEISVFVVGNYENASDNWSSMIFAASDDGWDDGWLLGQDNGNGDLLINVDNYLNCKLDMTADYGTDHIWTLIFNTTTNLIYGYKSESTNCTKAFNGPISYTGTHNLIIGESHTSSNEHMLGDIEEIIIYDVAVNDAQRIIISNYLSAKYNITLSVNDAYQHDGNGFDHDVAGIGRVDASNIHDDAQAGILRVLNPSGLGNNEFLFWGHNDSSQAAQNDIDVPGSVVRRLHRVWRFSEVNSSGTSVDVDSVDIRWDLNAMGLTTASDLRLLIDTDNDGSFADETEISGATSLGGNIYEFARVTGISDSARVTLGTINPSQTPLPIELLNFDANRLDRNTVNLEWTTATELGNAFFTVERSQYRTQWDQVTMVPGAGNSSQILNYSVWDHQPFSGLSHYRLKQTDIDGNFTYSHVSSVLMEDINRISTYPNPVSDMLKIKGAKEEVSDWEIYNLLGIKQSGLVSIHDKKEGLLELDLSRLASGIYLLKTKSTTTKIQKN